MLVIYTIDPGIFLAAMGITLLEMAEASAVGIVLATDSKNNVPYLAAIAGVLTILIPTAVAGNYISLLPRIYVLLASALLLLYFGIRLIKSARRSFKFQILGPSKNGGGHENIEKGVAITAYSVGVTEAFEAAIVLIALFPQNYSSTLIGLVAGSILVVIFAIILKTSIRKVKQAIMKAAVSAILLTFSAFWFWESYAVISNTASPDELFLIPLFVVFFAFVYYVASMNIRPKASA